VVVSAQSSKLEQFTNWLLQEIANSPTHSVVVRNVPQRLAMNGADIDDALRALRDQDVIACSNGRWWVRDKRAHRPAPIARQLTQAVVAAVAAPKKRSCR